MHDGNDWGEPHTPEVSGVVTVSGNVQELMTSWRDQAQAAGRVRKAVYLSLLMDNRIWPRNVDKCLEILLEYTDDLEMCKLLRDVRRALDEYPVTMQLLLPMQYDPNGIFYLPGKLDQAMEV